MSDPRWSDDQRKVFDHHRCGGCGRKVRWSAYRKGFVESLPDNGFVITPTTTCPGAYENHWAE